MHDANVGYLIQTLVFRPIDHIRQEQIFSEIRYFVFLKSILSSLEFSLLKKLVFHQMFWYAIQTIKIKFDLILLEDPNFLIRLHAALIDLLIDCFYCVWQIFAFSTYLLFYCLEIRLICLSVQKLLLCLFFKAEIFQILYKIQFYQVDAVFNLRTFFLLALPQNSYKETCGNFVVNQCLLKFSNRSGFHIKILLIFISFCKFYQHLSHLKL